MRTNKIDIVIGIDPDSEKNGVAFLDCRSKVMKTESLTFPELIERLMIFDYESKANETSYRVIIEAGWLNKSNWHLNPRHTKAVVAAIGNHVGRNHETGRKIMEMCEYHKIPYELIKPLALKIGGVSMWKGKDGKITHEELTAFTGITGRTNQEERDAALLAWTWAGFPSRVRAM